MTDAPRYATLRDYLRVLREQRWLLVLVTLVFAAAALALSIQAQPTYQAQASLIIHDESQDQALLSDAAATVSETPAAIAAALPATLGTPPVRNAALHLLGSGRPPAGSVSAYQDQTTGLVTVQAQSPSAAAAARLANAYAQAVSQVNRASLRARFQAAAVAVRAQFARLRDVSKDPVTRALYGDRVARISALAQTADPVSVSQPAAVPAVPVSPKPVRNTLLGALLGLALGVLAAFTRDALDRRLRGAADIGETLGLPILGHVRREALGRAGPLPSGGREPLTEADLEAFRILRQNLQFLDVDHPPHAVVVTSGLPEEGKSTVAASLACASALMGRRTLLLECDLRRPSLAKRMNLNAEPGLSDLLLGEAALADIVQRVSFETGSSNGSTPSGPPSDPDAGAGAYSGPEELHVITSGRRTSHPAELLVSQRFGRLVADAKADYATVIFDTSPLLSVADTLQVLVQADAALLCVRAGASTRDEARAVKETLQRVPDKRLGVVVTGLRPGSEGDFGYYSYAYAYADDR